jgi:hypothetical protein
MTAIATNSQNKYPEFVFAVYDHVEHNIAFFRDVRPTGQSVVVMYNLPVSSTDTLTMSSSTAEYDLVPFYTGCRIHPSVARRVWTWWRAPIWLTLKTKCETTLNVEVLVVADKNGAPFPKGKHPFFRAATLTVKDTAVPDFHAAYMRRYNAIVGSKLVVQTVIPKHVMTMMIEKAVADKESCGVTCEPITIENAAVTTCGHVFTETGLREALLRSKLCPVCRTECKAVTKA